MKIRMNIGISSLILIFIVLCLVTFGLLSLSSARNDLSLAERNGNAVKEFYKADSEGEQFIAMADKTLKAIGGGSVSGPEDISRELLEKQFGQFYDKEEDLICTDIPMDRGQSLRVELGIGIDEERGTWCSVQAFYVYNQEDYEIDQSMPVWTGQ